MSTVFDIDRIQDEQLPQIETILCPSIRQPFRGIVHHEPRWKTAVDWLISIMILPLAAPLMLLGFLLVKLTSPGPGFYSQTRIGLSGRRFTIYKLRTMYHNCEQVSGIRWSALGDQRITPIGNILRILHIDELPQLWNIFRGDMSLIGPRPERPEIIASLIHTYPNYHYRHLVKPGITGMAQVQLPPDTLVEEVRKKLIFDRFYIDHRTFLLDLKILGWTFLKIVGGRNLYRRKLRCEERS